MNDCTRIAPLLEVYADDEASAETNALVLDHLQHCDRCARALRGIVALRAGVRDALRTGGAPPRLLASIRSTMDERQPLLWGRLARWMAAPASVALIVAAIWMARGQRADAQVETAVAEHVMCALEGRGPRLADAVAAERGLAVAMPWIHDQAGGVRIVEAHTCGDAHPFSHVVLDVDGATASILIAARERAGAAAPPAPVVSGDFDVSVVTTAKHVAYVIADRRHGDRLGALRGPTLRRVERFLQQMEQMEGPS